MKVVIAHARGVSAAVCCAILSAVLVVFVTLVILPKTRNKFCRTVVKCRSFRLIAVSVLYQINFVMQLVCYYYHDEEYMYCIINTFFSQYFGTVRHVWWVSWKLQAFSETFSEPRAWPIVSAPVSSVNTSISWWPYKKHSDTLLLTDHFIPLLSSILWSLKLSRVSRWYRHLHRFQSHANMSVCWSPTISWWPWKMFRYFAPNG